MEKKHSLTNENLTKKFKSNFDLVTYAIKLAENMIKTGREPRVKSDTQNKAMLLLEEIEMGKDQLDPIEEENDSDSAPEESSVVRVNGENVQGFFHKEKNYDRKKSQALLRGKGKED